LTRLPLIALVPLIAACSHHGPGATAELSWCRQPRDGAGREWKSIADPRIEIIPARKLPRALDLLKDRGALKLSPGQVRSFLGRDMPGPGHYLVRAGAMAKPNSDLQGVVGEMQGAHFEAEWSPRGNIVNVRSTQLRKGPADYFNVAAIIATDLPVEDVYVACFAMS
jgi:hypothetical protein